MLSIDQTFHVSSTVSISEKRDIGSDPSLASGENGYPLAGRRDNEDLWIPSNKIKIVLTEDAHASVQDSGV
jgi:hypothetical protein